MGKLKSMMRQALYRRIFKQLTRTIMHQVEAAEELWEIDEALDLLWNLGDKGDLNAMVIYALILLMEDKQWYDSRQGLIILEEIADAGSLTAQFLYGYKKLRGGKDIEQDPVTGMWWIRKAAENGHPDAMNFIRMQQA